jgi:soluble lytic murein transglycosylase
MIAFLQRHRWWFFAVILAGAGLLLVEAWRARREHSQDGVILAAARRHSVAPALVKAVVWRESWFNPRAMGTRGEVGLMQVRPPTAQDWAAATKAPYLSFGQMFNPGWNTDCGAWYLRKQLDRYRNTDNPLPYALAAYNAGPGNAAKWAKGAGATNSGAFVRQIDFPTTRDYVTTVLKRYRRYEHEFPVAAAREPRRGS